MDPESGAQPLKSRDQTVTVAANGEIYNYKDLYTEVSALDYVTRNAITARKLEERSSFNLNLQTAFTPHTVLT